MKLRSECTRPDQGKPKDQRSVHTGATPRTRRWCDHERIEYSRVHSIADAVANAPHRANQFPLIWVVHFAAEVAHVDVHDVVDAIEALVPDVFDDHGARQNPARIRHQVFEQGIFFRGQVNPFAAALHLLREAIEFQISHANHAAATDRPAPEQRLDPNQELREGEGLGEIVIGTCLKVTHLVFDRIASRQNQYRNVRVQGPQTAEDLGTIHFWQHQVENYEVVAVGSGHFEPGLAIGDHIDREALGHQPTRHEARHFLFVFNQQNPHYFSRALVYCGFHRKPKQSEEEK